MALAENIKVSASDVLFQAHTAAAMQAPNDLDAIVNWIATQLVIKHGLDEGDATAECAILGVCQEMIEDDDEVAGPIREPRTAAPAVPPTSAPPPPAPAVPPVPTPAPSPPPTAPPAPPPTSQPSAQDALLQLNQQNLFQQFSTMNLNGQMDVEDDM